MAVKVEDLHKALGDEPPPILHFSGRGAGARGLSLESDAGKMHLSSIESLNELLSLFKDTIERAFLKAGDSKVQI